MAQNEMRAMRGLPQGVRLSAGLALIAKVGDESIVVLICRRTAMYGSMAVCTQHNQIIECRSNRRGRLGEWYLVVDLEDADRKRFGIC